MCTSRGLILIIGPRIARYQYLPLSFQPIQGNTLLTVFFMHLLDLPHIHALFNNIVVEFG